jgi:hypothetical protein
MPSTALNLGLEAGLRYASENNSDRRRLARIVRAHTADEVAAILSGDVGEPDGIDDRVAYWSGFAHGVSRFLQDVARGPEPTSHRRSTSSGVWRP